MQLTVCGSVKAHGGRFSKQSLGMLRSIPHLVHGMEWRNLKQPQKLRSNTVMHGWQTHSKSEPDIFTGLMQELGVSDTLQFTNVY
jgi:hypothetical protein